MAQFGVRCTMGDGEDTVITVDADDAAAALEEVRSHQRLFYGPGDGAGRALAAARPASTIVTVHEAKPLADWSLQTSA